MKEQKKRIMALLAERLSKYGFKKRMLNTFIYEIDDNRLQNISFTSATHKEKQTIYLNPVIGFSYKNVNRLFSELMELPFEYPEYIYTTISSPLGYLMPVNNFKEWRFTKDEDVEQEVNLMADAIIKYGFPYLEELGKENEVVYGLDISKYKDGMRDFHLPIFYYLRGNHQRALICIEEAIKKRSNSRSQEKYEIINDLPENNEGLLIINKDLEQYLPFADRLKQLIQQ